MAMDWKVLQKEIYADNTRIIDEAPEDIERVFKYEIIPTGAGTAKTTLGVWFEGATAARYVAAYNTYNIIKLAMDPAFTLERIKELVEVMLPKVTAAVKLCGYAVYARFTEETMACVKEMDNKDDALSLLNSLYLYGSSMNAWTHHFFKWAIGQATPIPTREDCEAIGRAASKAYIEKNI